MSSPVRMPLSETAVTPFGRSRARRSETSSDTSRVARFRLLTPTKVAPLASAFSSSGSSCTSTSASIP